MRKKAARITEVARLAGVSPGLVSRIINNDATLKVRAETRARVMDAIDKLDYAPDSTARALRSARTGLLGFALHHVNDPVYTDMVDAAQVAATSRNHSIMLLNTTELLERGDAFREIVHGRRVDGLLIQSGFGDADADLRALAGTVPSILFNGAPMPGTRTLRLDDGAAAAAATEHLVALGHRDIAFVGADGAAAARRLDAYRAAMERAGLAPLPPLHGGWSPDEAKAAVTRYLADRPSATAFVVVTTTTAIGVHSAIATAGLRIPDDIALISVHDAWFAPHLNPPLTVVALPFGTLGTRAVDLLIRQIHEPTTGETIIADDPPRLIERGSTAPPRSRETLP
ncbi:LacI family DNA-binding transcriptional regulator [Jiangella sp. DSM 45060]|uniref:LacI family DNA-binding transcriptional regulator n=1 Tax=Jiangella sp. DSM 45060 TaxID=1798224 RepID=UPI00087D8B49|nr:LacI family DNA-binding transcriptional regulator [Jiangella sp. DSM 45060]SDS49246.1 transcriptional regulator, LacI family [Jiangella sp. DSM 45060]